ncbi:MAG: hypothetical protein ACM3ON_01070 [Chloroflexota bacterium]
MKVVAMKERSRSRGYSWFELPVVIARGWFYHKDRSLLPGACSRPCHRSL